MSKLLYMSDEEYTALIYGLSIADVALYQVRDEHRDSVKTVYNKLIFLYGNPLDEEE